jgi:hypothetical protein
MGFILIYFVGKAFAKLAEENDKHKWLYGILGVISYYGGSFLCGFIIGVFMEFGFLEFLYDLSDTMFGIVCIPFGVLICWGFYHFLKNRWGNKKSHNRSNSILLDD